MRTTGTKKLAVHSESDEEMTSPAADSRGGAVGLSSGPADDMAEEKKPKEEPKQDNAKPVKNGGYTIPVQMY